MTFSIRHIVLLMAQPIKKYEEDPLDKLRTQIKELILKNYRSIDEFCMVEDFQKSSMSRFLNPPKEVVKRRTEYQLYTLYRLAKILKKKLVPAKEN